MTKSNTYKTNKCKRSTQTSFLFPNRGDHNVKRNEEMRGQRTREEDQEENKYKTGIFMRTDVNFNQT